MRVKRRAAERVQTCWGPRIFAGLLSELRRTSGGPLGGLWADLGAEDPATGFRPSL
jgi:hypothetical protein